ncbi:hypothetical protein [Candidatus Nitrospira bockiana]
MTATVAIEMSAEERAVWREIQRHEGRASALSLEHLAAVTAIAPRIVQRIVKHLIEHHHCPIGSATGEPHGYYVIRTTDEQTRAERQLEHRIIKTAQRLAALRKNTPADVLGQLTMELTQSS